MVNKTDGKKLLLRITESLNCMRCVQARRMCYNKCNEWNDWNDTLQMINQRTQRQIMAKIRLSVYIIWHLNLRLKIILSFGGKCIHVIFG